jgi:hypothetical protein
VAAPLLAAGLLMLWFPGWPTAGAAGTFLGGLSTITPVSSTVPPRGDVNPYGVAVVPRSVGDLHAGDVLVSNFNNKQNLQGTGHTIVEISPAGVLRVFANINLDPADRRCPGGVGLTTALAVFSRGVVIVGSLPTADGTAATAKAGCLIVLDSRGRVLRTIAGGPINGPWDMAALDLGSQAVLFVTNVLNGTVAANGAVVNRGTVVRVGLELEGEQPPEVSGETVIGSGLSERTDPSALVIGPTGLGFSHGSLYVADTLNNRIAAIPHALTRQATAFAGVDVSSGGSLNGPLGLTIAPNGDVVTVNSGDGNAVETTPSGAQVATKLLDNTPPPPTGGAGTLFGLAVAPGGGGLYFVDDGSNTLSLLH